MPRLRYIDESEKSPHTRELIESAKRTGAPDPRVVSLVSDRVLFGLLLVTSLAAAAIWKKSRTDRIVN